MANTYTLLIEKDGINKFRHTHDDLSGTKFSISDFNCSIDGNQFKIIEKDGASRFAYLITNITVKDNTDAGTPETFVSPTVFEDRLRALGYTAYLNSGGASSSQTLQQTNANGNTSNIDIQFQGNAGIVTPSGAALRKGTVNHDFGGGISRICVADKEDQWENGVRYLRAVGGANVYAETIDNIVPDASYDNTKGWAVGSYYKNLVTNNLYKCTDATTGDAVWELQSNTPTLQTVITAGNTYDGGNSITSFSDNVIDIVGKVGSPFEGYEAYFTGDGISFGDANGFGALQKNFLDISDSLGRILLDAHGNRLLIYQTDGYYVELAPTPGMSSNRFIKLPDESGTLALTSVEKSKAEIDTLIATNGLIAGRLYKITGVHPTLYDDGTTSGTTIYLHAISTNELEVNGVGEFYNTTYPNVGGWGIYNPYVQVKVSDIVGTFNENEAITADNGATGTLFGKVQGGFIIPISGDWSASVSITGDSSGATTSISILEMPSNHAINDVIFWGGYEWKNTTGNLGSFTDVLNLNADWEKQPYSTGNYTKVIGEIKYDYANDWIEYRADNIGNEVSFNKKDNDSFIDNYGFNFSSISTFQFGLNIPYAGTYNNKVNNGYCENINFRGLQYYNNTQYQGSAYYNNVQGQGSQYLNNTQGINSNYSNNVQGISSLYSNNTQGQGSNYQNMTLANGVKIKNTTFEANTNIDNIDISGATTIYDANSKTVYSRPDGAVRIRYYNNSDAMVIVPFDN